MKHVLRLGALVMGCATTTRDPAWAAEPDNRLDPVEITESHIGSELDATTAVGSRLQLSVGETPAAIELLDEIRLRERGARTSIEALNLAVGVTAADLPSSPGVTSMRGFTGGAISLLYDGIRQTAAPLITRDIDTWSLERVEVIKGPASVLYGEGALAGAVNLVPKRAQFERTVMQAQFGIGSFGARRVAADVNLPLGGDAALRAVASDGRDEGHVDDTAAQRSAGMLAFRTRIGEDALLDIALDHYRDDYDTPYWGTPLVPVSVARDPLPLVQSASGFVIDRALRERNFNVGDGFSSSRSDWLQSRLSWRLDETWTFTNTLDHYEAQRHWRNTETYSWSPAIAALSRRTTDIAHDHRYRVERAALSADADLSGQRNRFTAGVEYSESSFVNPRRFGSAAPVDPYALQRGRYPQGDGATLYPGNGNRVDFDADSRVTALFVEDALNLGSRWLLVGGLRRDRIDLDRSVVDYNAATRTRFRRDYAPVSWRVGTVFDATATTHLYAQYSKAVAPVSSLFLISQANARFDLTTGEAVDAGLKGTFWNERLDLGVALYWLRQDDIVTRDPANSSIAIQGGSQSARGIELSASARLSEALHIDAGIAALDARFDVLREAGGADRSGNTPPHVPERMASLFAHYRFGALPLTLSLGARHVGRFYTNAANSIRVDDHRVVDTALSWRLRNGEITLRGRNLGDAVYADWSGGASDQLVLGAPRSVELSWLVRR